MKIWNFSAWALQLLSSFPTIATPAPACSCSWCDERVVTSGNCCCWWSCPQTRRLSVSFPASPLTAAPWPGDWTDADQDNKRNKRSVARGRCTQHTHLKQLFYIQSTLAPIIRIQEWDWDVVKFSSLDHLGYKDGTVDSLMWRYHHLLILVVEFNLLLLLEFSFI